MKKIPAIVYAFFIFSLLDACSSGKAAMKKGNYYDATMEAIQRLRENPNHKRAIDVLTQAYPLTIDYIDNSIQNGIKSDDPKKWRNAVAGYTKINFINDQINTSPGAKKIIAHPQLRLKELADARVNAAEEAYSEGINEMMKNQREDYKQAYYDFKDANSYQQGYKESIEMQNQAEFKATVRVAYEEINNSRYNYGSFQPVIHSLQRLFLSFKPIAQKDTVPPQQYLRIIFNGYQENRPYISTRTETQTRQIVVGQVKGADGKMVDQTQSVSANVTYFHKTIAGSSQANVTITNVADNAQLQNFSVDGAYNWVYDWATYSGDARALSGNASSWVQRRESYPNPQDVYNQTMRVLQSNLSQQLKSYYNQY
ncbi:MAG: hypothetical protein JST43_14250 [Bacteroidetes bacterium]|nr:hypothetical protein [Bacteroidota bacterium]MBS1541468.1 hypothetical protein [Bacteroidota bacterium]